MPIREKLVLSGVSPYTAKTIAGNIEDNLAASGDNICTAAQVQEDIGVVTYCDRGEGVRLRKDLIDGDEQIIVNFSVNDLMVYPAHGFSINNEYCNTPIILSPSISALFKCIGRNRLITL